MSKRNILHEFPQKYFKTTEMHNLEVCSSLCWEKLFLLIFTPFYWFDQKQLFKQIQFFLGFSPFKHGKKKFLSISVHVSEIVTFMSKKKSSPWIFPKMLQNNTNA